MAKLFPFGGWTLRRTGMPTRPNVTERDLQSALGPRPEIARGQLTAFRRFRMKDAPELLMWGRHSDILLESYNMPIENRDDARQWFLGRDAWMDCQLFAVDSLAEERVVGYIGLREIDLKRRTSVLGISFDPATVGRGYGTDALSAFLRYYFEDWEYNSMLLDVAGPNVRAQRCYKKCGFRYVGERWKEFSDSTRQVLKSPAVQKHPEMFRFKGSQCSILYYDMSISRAEWRAYTSGGV